MGRNWVNENIKGFQNINGIERKSKMWCDSNEAIRGKYNGIRENRKSKRRNSNIKVKRGHNFSYAAFLI